MTLYTVIWTRHHDRWKAANFYLWSALMVIEQRGFLVCHVYCDTGHPVAMVISEDPWHSHLSASVWQCSCHYLFLRLRSVAAGIRTPNLSLADALTHCATSAYVNIAWIQLSFEPREGKWNFMILYDLSLKRYVSFALKSLRELLILFRY